MCYIYVTELYKRHMDPLLFLVLSTHKTIMRIELLLIKFHKALHKVAKYTNSEYWKYVLFTKRTCPLLQGLFSSMYECMYPFSHSLYELIRIVFANGFVAFFVKCIPCVSTCCYSTPHTLQQFNIPTENQRVLMLLPCARVSTVQKSLACAKH